MRVVYLNYHKLNAKKIRYPRGGGKKSKACVLTNAAR